MREESEIIAMRDKLERYALHHYGLGDQGLAVLAALRWATDPLTSDGQLLSTAEGDETPPLTALTRCIRDDCRHAVLTAAGLPYAAIR